MHFGIDYGSKLAGTTVITYDLEGVLHQLSSSKKEDADAMILKCVSEHTPEFIFLDAPLSLPNAYFGKGSNYFYREADKKLHAMSPMFLGGLTARAMQLKAEIDKLSIAVYETYPGALVRSIPELREKYLKKSKTPSRELIQLVTEVLKETTLDKIPNTMHEIDSILAWYSGYRFLKGSAVQIGNQEEGVIVY